MTLKEYLEFRKMPAAHFARIMGVHPTHIAGIASGRIPPSDKMKQKIMAYSRGKVRFENDH